MGHQRFNDRSRDPPLGYAVYERCLVSAPITAGVPHDDAASSLYLRERGLSSFK